MGSEYCVCCGRDIPEGRQICPTCEMSLPQNNRKQSFVEKVANRISTMYRKIRHLWQPFFYCPIEITYHGCERRSGSKVQSQRRGQSLMYCGHKRNRGQIALYNRSEVREGTGLNLTQRYLRYYCGSTVGILRTTFFVLIEDRMAPKYLGKLRWETLIPLLSKIIKLKRPQ